MILYYIADKVFNYPYKFLCVFFFFLEKGGRGEGGGARGGHFSG